MSTQKHPPNGTLSHAARNRRLNRSRNLTRDNRSPSVVVRIVVNGSPFGNDWTDNSQKAQEMLFQAFKADSWPPGTAKYALTPGGFIQAPLPDNYDGVRGWGSAQDFKKLLPIGQDIVESVVSKKILRTARNRTKFLTLGVDLKQYQLDRDKKDVVATHAELVAIVEIASGEVVHWTGKSYPVAWQENKLIQAPLESHLFRCGRERVLVLGCHDLNMFSNRSCKNAKVGGMRWQRTSKMQCLAEDFKPTVVLHHPHATDSPRIWQTAWSGTREKLPTGLIFASGIAYCNHKESPRAGLDDVCAKTCFGHGVSDVIVDGYR